MNKNDDREEALQTSRRTRFGWGPQEWEEADRVAEDLALPESPRPNEPEGKMLGVTGLGQEVGV